MTYRVCSTYKGKQYCFTIGTPIITPQLPPWDPRSESEGYPGLVNDLNVLAGVHNMVNAISDKQTQEALLAGLHSALSAIQKRGEEHGFSVSENKQSQSANA